MSDEEKPLEFSAFDLMPEWAQEKQGSKKPKETKRRFDDEKGEGRGGEGRGGDRRGGGGGGGGGGGFRGNDRRGGSDRRGGDRRGSDRRGSDRRGSDRRGGDRRGGDRRGGDRRGGDRRDDRPRYEPLKGVKAKLEPTEAAVKGLSKHIRETLRAFPIADLAKMILKGRDRYQVRFEADENGPQLFQCKDDGSVWLTREEAISHLLSEGALEKFYDIDEVDIGAPSGNFAQIAVCGMSGALLGPPNHHEYQRNVMRLHAEKFSNMSLERFKSRIEMQSDEEVIERWKESVSKQKQYRLKSDKPVEEEKEEPVPLEGVAEEAGPSEEETVTTEEVADAAETEEVPAEAADSTAAETEDKTSEEETSEEEVAEEEVAGEEGSESEASDSEDSSGEEGEAQVADDSSVAESAPEETEQPAEDTLVLKSPEELARHFKAHFAKEAIEETKVAVVPGNIPGRSLSQGLLEHLKRESESLRRGFPLPMVQAVCSALEKEGLRFFKRGKKALHVSAVRPRPIKESVSFSSEVQAIVDYVLKHSGARVMDLLDELAEDFVRPEKSAPTEALELTEGARKVLKDLRWLTSEGYLIELPDTRVIMGKVPRQEGGNSPSKKKTARKKTAAKKKSAPSQKAEAPKESEKTEEQPAEESPAKESEDVAKADVTVPEPEPESEKSE